MKDKEISIPETEECTLAHVDYETQRIQSMQEHAGNVVLFLSNVCELSELKNLVELAGILHDAGKLGTKNQDDFRIFGSWVIRYINMDWIILLPVEDLRLN